MALVGSLGEGKGRGLMVDSEATTVVIPPEIEAAVDAHGSLVINNPGGGQ